MIIWTKAANKTLYGTVARYLGRRRSGDSYGPPPIFYWCRNIQNEVNLMDGDVKISSRREVHPMNNDLGSVIYTYISIQTHPTLVVLDFVFNSTTLARWINHKRSAADTKNTRKAEPLFNSPTSKIVKSRNIGYKIICSEYADGSIRLTWKGRNIPLKSQFDKLIKPFARWRNGIYAIGEKDGVQYKLFANDTVQPLNEQRNKNVLRLTESQFKQMLVECITEIMKEIA